MKNSRLAIAAAAVAVLAAAGIGLTVYTVANANNSTAAPSATSTAPVGDQAHGDHDELVPAPTSTPDQGAAAAAATDALTAYARRDLAYPEWFAQLEPYLHPSAVDAYATVDPSNIPEIVVTGTAETAGTSSDTYAVVFVPTSAGEYTVELRRDDPAANWGVTRFQPPV